MLGWKVGPLCQRDPLQFGSVFGWTIAMPRVAGIPGPYRFFFYSFDCNEPQHVHVRRERAVCKFWLDPVALGYNNGFSDKELTRIRRTIVDHLDHIQEAWNEHCGNQ
jgi:hypothetical protein